MKTPAEIVRFFADYCLVDIPHLLFSHLNFCHARGRLHNSKVSVKQLLRWSYKGSYCPKEDGSRTLIAIYFKCSSQLHWGSFTLVTPVVGAMVQDRKGLIPRRPYVDVMGD